MVRYLRSVVSAIHRRLLPARPEIGWTPYLWLFYLSFIFWRWAIEAPSSTELILSGVGVAVFLVLYFNGYWHYGNRLLANMAGIVLVGLLLTPMNPGALTFFVYAAGFAGFVGSPRRGWISVGAIVGVIIVFALLFGMPWFWTLLSTFLCVMIGAVNIYFAEVGRKNAALRRSQEEVERLASLAERERIARDFHDLLGHTLTVITVKAELARKLSERGDGRAAEEIADVERISREALAQVRTAVAGFADIGLQGELRRARLIAEARGIEIRAEIEDHDLDARRETALAMVLREAITNMIRHSKAKSCRIELGNTGTSVILRIEDDGRGALRKSQGVAGGGHGLESMRQRLAVLGGYLDIEPRIDESGGFRVTARLPIDRPAYENSLTVLSRVEPEPA